MMTFGKIAAASPLQVANMTKHLMAMTTSPEEQQAAAYYTRGAVAHDSVMLDCAHSVAAGSITMAQAMEALLEDWAKTNPPPDAAAMAQAADKQYPFGVPPDVPDPYEAIDKAMEEWEERRFLADGRLYARLDTLVERIDQNVLDAPLAVLRPDVDARVLVGLGIECDRLLSMAEISNLLVGLRADGTHIEGKHYAVEREMQTDPKTGERKWSTPIGSYDFTASADKTVSVAWAFASAGERAQIYGAHLEAVRFAMAYIADEVGQARMGKGGKDGFEPGHVAWLEFTHFTARKTAVGVDKDGNVTIDVEKAAAGDPDLHTHCLIPNAVFCESGRVGSLDTDAINGFLKEAGAVYQARLATLLRDRGFDADLDEKTGSARMTVIPEDMRELFSKRANQGELLAKRFTADKGEVWDDLADDQRAARIAAATQSWQQRQRGGKDDVADFESWTEQAKAIGWSPPRTLHRIGPPPPPLTREERIQASYQTSLPWLDEHLQKSAVVPHWTLRRAALRGAVRHGLESLDDIDRVTKIMRTDGVCQYGVNTALIWGQEDDKRYVSVTTALHEREEKELVQLIKHAAADKSQVIPDELLERKVSESGLDFSDAHGQAQHAAMWHAGTSGKFALVVAAAGAGKTTSLYPLVAAWMEQGRPVYGDSLAWRQADDLSRTGIKKRAAMAHSVLLGAAERGELNLHERSVVVLDEFGMLGTRDALRLMRLQAKHGFSVVALGDDKQTASIEAGASIALVRRALGVDNVPEIVTTRRQEGDREKDIAKLFRDGEAKRGLDMKREDGTAEMVHGGRSGVIARVAQVYAERIQAGPAPMAYAPTNSDAHQISAALRLERRKLGMVGPDLKTIQATDGERDYDLRIARGDHLRLHKSTGARYSDKTGGAIGRNGSVVEVMDVTDAGLTLQAKTGKVGFVPWERMAAERGRYTLSYGDATTIHTAQGSDGPRSLFVLPSGSQAINGGLGYTALTRHKFACDLYTNEQAERIAVRESRPINDTHEITEDDKWAIVGKNLRHGVKRDSALEMMSLVDQVHRGTVHAFQKLTLHGPQPASAVVQQHQWAAAQQMTLSASPAQPRQQQP